MEKQKVQNAIQAHRLLNNSFNTEEIKTRKNTNSKTLFLLILNKTELTSFFVRIESCNEIINQTSEILEICNEDKLGPFIKSKYNKVDECYRSPLSNEYFPQSNIGKYPPNELRKIEEEMGKLMSYYIKLYYGPNAISSVYAWELGDSLLNGFSASVLIINDSETTSELERVSEDLENNIKTITNNTTSSKPKNFINSNNLFNVKFSLEAIKNKEYIKVCYKLQSTMTIGLKSDIGFSLGSNITKNFEENHYIKDYTDTDFHIEKLGKMLEYAENTLRLAIEEVELKKYWEIMSKLKVDNDVNTQRGYFQGVIEEHQINAAPNNS